MTDLSRGLYTFDDARIDDDPTDEQTDSKMPLNAADVANVGAVCAAQHHVSTPHSQSTTFAVTMQWTEHRTRDREVVGSSPTHPSH